MADVNAFVLTIEIVSREVPPVLIVVGEKFLDIVGLDGETGSVSAAVQIPDAHSGLLLVTLAGGEITAVFVSCVCA